MSNMCKKCKTNQAKNYNNRYLSLYCWNCASDKMSTTTADSYIWELAKRELLLG